jgi:tetratricopeptide (TPR) repeat protein
MPDETQRQAAERHYFSALDHYAEGRHREAIADYEAAISADPSFLDAMHGLARVYQDIEDYDRAIAVATRITELDPDDVLAHTSLSILYQRKGMVPEAEAEANKARILGWKQQLKQGKQSPELKSQE